MPFDFPAKCQVCRRDNFNDSSQDPREDKCPALLRKKLGIDVESLSCWKLGYEILETEATAVLETATAAMKDGETVLELLMLAANGHPLPEGSEKNGLVSGVAELRTSFDKVSKVTRATRKLFESTIKYVSDRDGDWVAVHRSAWEGLKEAVRPLDPQDPYNQGKPPI